MPTTHHLLRWFMSCYARWMRMLCGLHVQAHNCSMALVHGACAVRRDASSRDRQFLFSFYSHPRPNYTEHPLDSVLHGRVVPVRIEVMTDLMPDGVCLQSASSGFFVP